MIKFPFKLTSKKCLGIDIGISSIKVVELSRGRKNILENYGEIETKFLYQRSLGTLGETPLLLSSQAIARAILSVLEAAEIKTKKAIFSIPDFSSFFTNFVLPPMAKEEIPEAVRFEARQHIPLPLSAVTLDWQIIQRGVAKEEKGVKILLVAVSNEIIHQYRKIAEYANLELLALEAEVFGLLRSSVSAEDEKKVISSGKSAKETLEKAKKEKNAKFIKGDLLKIPLKKESVNVVLEIASLHHIPSKKLREKAIKEVNRVLKKNGIFIVSVWNLSQPKYKKYIKKAFLKSILTLGKYDPRDTFIPWAKKAERYYYAFKENELKRLLETHNFEIIEQEKNNNIVFICKKKK